MSSMSRYYKLLIAIALVLGVVIIVLSQIKKTVHVTVEVEASHAAFTLEGSVENFLSINNRAAAGYGIRLASYQQALVPGAQVLRPEDSMLAPATDTLRFIPEDGDPTASLRLEGVAIGKISLRPGHRLELNALSEESGRMRFHLVDFGDPISLSSLQDTVSLRPKRSLLAPEETEAEDMEVLLPAFSAISITPLDKSLQVSLHFAEAASLTEDDVMTISHLSFTENKGGVLHSAILSGKVSILETGKEVAFGKNKTLRFAPGDRFDVTDLSLSGERVRMVFEGETSQMQLGYAGRRYIPSLLEYLYHNNFLLILFNSYMVVISLILSFLGSIKKDREEVQKKNKPS